jgi:AAA ATPase domain
MIVGRAAELCRLDELLAGLRRGQGGALVVHGEAGIGKTTLLDALVERCGEGVTVLRARGAETEAELAFSALADLLHPVLDELETLPSPQAAALAGALALGPPVPGDRLAVCVAVLGVLRSAAKRRPVLAVLDDVQWADASSRECVAYVARRAGGSLSVVLAARDPWYAPERARLPELSVGPVDDDGAAELLRRRAPDLAPSVAAAIEEAAAGNPLALAELPATLTARQRRGVAALDLPLAPGSRLQHAFEARVDALDPLTQRAVLIAATDVAGDLPAIAAACDQAQTDVRHLVEAEAHGLVALDATRVTFAHPLIRGAVYRGATAAERRAAHAALASALRDERRVWHLAAASVGPDERVATELERVGTQAAARRAYAPAAAAFERAAGLSADAETASRRLLAAGEAAAAGRLAEGFDGLGPHWPWMHLLLRGLRSSRGVRVGANGKRRPMRASARSGSAGHAERRAAGLGRCRLSSRRLGRRRTEDARVGQHRR